MKLAAECEVYSDDQKVNCFSEVDEGTQQNAGTGFSEVKASGFLTYCVTEAVKQRWWNRKYDTSHMIFCWTVVDDDSVKPVSNTHHHRVPLWCSQRPNYLQHITLHHLTGHDWAPEFANITSCMAIFNHNSKQTQGHTVSAFLEILGMEVRCKNRWIAELLSVWAKGGGMADWGRQ